MSDNGLSRQQWMDDMQAKILTRMNQYGLGWKGYGWTPTVNQRYNSLMATVKLRLRWGTNRRVKQDDVNKVLEAVYEILPERTLNE